MEPVQESLNNMESAERGVVNTESAERDVVNMEAAERGVVNMEWTERGLVEDNLNCPEANLGPRKPRETVSQNIEELVSSIATLGDHCAILYLDEENNRVKHYGTAAGKEFLTKQQGITSQFLAFCYNVEVIQCSAEEAQPTACETDTGGDLSVKSPHKRKLKEQTIPREKKRRLSSSSDTTIEDTKHVETEDSPTIDDVATTMGKASVSPQVCLKRVDEAESPAIRKSDVVGSESEEGGGTGRRVLGKRSSAIKFKEMMMSLGKRNRRTSATDTNLVLQGTTPNRKSIGRTPKQLSERKGNEKKHQNPSAKLSPPTDKNTCTTEKGKSCEVEISSESQQSVEAKRHGKAKRKEAEEVEVKVEKEVEDDFVLDEIEETEEEMRDLEDENWGKEVERKGRKNGKKKSVLGAKRRGNMRKAGKIRIKLETPKVEEECEGDDSKDSDVEPRCLECGKEYKNMSGLQRHLKMSGHEQVSMVETDYKCYTCYRYYQRMCDLERHMEATSHTGIDVKNIERKMETINHIKDDRKSKAMFRCGVCRAEYRHAENCQEHMEKGTCIPKWRKKCPCCPLAFTTKNFWHVHLRKKHRQEYPYKCAHCTKVFYNLRSLQNHSQTHRNKVDRNVSESQNRAVSSETQNKDKGAEAEGVEKFGQSDVVDDTTEMDETQDSLAEDLTNETESTSSVDITEEKMDPELRLKLIRRMQRRIRGIAEDQDVSISDDLDGEQTCSVCSEKFVNYTQLKVHIMSSDHEQVAEEETGYKCFTCDTYFVKLVDLEGHMEKTSHTGNPEGKQRREAVRIQRKVNRRYGKDFKCSFCIAEFSTLEKCQQHVDKATCEKRYKKKCECCNLFFTRKNLYCAHMYQLHRCEFPFKCDKCVEEFETLTSFLSHLRTHPKDSEFELGAYKCTQCEKRFGKKFRLLTHMQKEHGNTEGSEKVDSVIDTNGTAESTDYKCFTCERFYRNLVSLEEHMKTTGHTGNPEYTEEICLVPTVMTKNTEDPNKVSKPLRCSKCRFRFPSFETGRGHIKRGKCKAYWRRLCPCCSKIFLNKNLYEAHLKEFHKHEYPFKCEDCAKIFYHASAFNSHRVNTHNSAPFRLFPEGAIKVLTCPVCSKSFRGQGNYNQHMKSAHTGIKPYICEQCGMKFSRPHYLKEHIQAQHERDPNDPKLVCQYCGKTFKTVKTKLMHEKMMHLRDKEHTCDICGYQARKIGTLNYHIAQNHTAQAAFTCNECGEKFRVKPHFNLHMANHALQRGDLQTAETYCKIHRCPMCEKAFAQKSRCDLHMLKHMGEQGLVTCKICGQRVACSIAGLRNHYRRKHKLPLQTIKAMMENELAPKDLLAKARENLGDEVPVPDVPFEGRLPRTKKTKKKKSQRPHVEESDDEMQEEATQFEEVYEEFVAIPFPSEKSESKNKVDSEVRDYLAEAESQISILERTNELPSTSGSEEVIVQLNSEHSQTLPSYVEEGGRIHLIIPDGGGEIILQDRLGNVMQQNTLSASKENGVFTIKVGK